LISEKSIWKNQVQQTGFLVYFELVSYCRLKIQFIELDFSNWIFQKPSTDKQGGMPYAYIQISNLFWQIYIRNTKSKRSKEKKFAI
jgi:hypothetical protein